MRTNRSDRLRLYLATSVAAALCACSNGGGDSPKPGITDVDAGIELPEQVRGMLDVLFMIDNSGSMRKPQALLRRAFPAFEAAIRNPQGVLPSLHIGVVSSDLGAGDYGGSTPCGRPDGDMGKLRVRDGCGIQPGSPPFIISLKIKPGDGGTGTMTNFAGSLSDVFSCVADLGDSGCGFEHQLESVRRALAGSTESGFLRADAALAIILLTDEDDCSAPADSDLFKDRQFDGQQMSLRCSLVGHECNGSPPPNVPFETSIANCTAAADGGGRLIPVQDISSFVKGLNPNFPQRITVSAITGLPADPSAEYAFTNTGELDVEPICGGKNGSTAKPSLRITQFVNSFGAQGTLETICADDYAPALKRIGERIAVTLK